MSHGCALGGTWKAGLLPLDHLISIDRLVYRLRQLGDGLIPDCATTEPSTCPTRLSCPSSVSAVTANLGSPSVEGKREPCRIRRLHH
jgi:hypothetical protein